MAKSPTYYILNRIENERARQDAKWGEQNHAPALWAAILGEEFGEACRAVFERDMKHLCEELVHVAAVAVAFIESVERNTKA